MIEVHCWTMGKYGKKNQEGVFYAVGIKKEWKKSITYQLPENETLTVKKTDIISTEETEE